MKEIILSEFVKEILKERDESHGYEHLKQVAENSKIIFHTIKSIKDDEKLYELTITVAWLHDVIDHKYEDSKENMKKMNVFLEDNFPNEKELILKIIDRISYSKENKSIKNNEKLDWTSELGEKGVLVRNIVSDADKLEAIGELGLIRCIAYTIHSYFEKNKKMVEKEYLTNEVIQHSKEKLLRLKDEFIRTEKGLEMATILHQELLESLKNIDFHVNNEMLKFSQ
jgi:uncharacterized protein